MRIAVVGLGKVGLPLAVQFAVSGHQVVGVDIDEHKVAQVNLGQSPVDNEQDLDARLLAVTRLGNLEATTHTSDAVAGAEAVVVVVPLVTDSAGVPDFSLIDGATEAIGRGLRKGTLVSLETTVPVGTTRKRVKPILEARSGLKTGSDSFLVFSPERVFTGRIFQDLRSYPKLVGGVDPASESKGVWFYGEALQFDLRQDLARSNGVWAMGSSEAAEFAKLAETAHRDVNIALANQYALIAEQLGIDVWKVIEACNSQPFSHILRPGIAVGGHCLPVYPELLLWGSPEISVVRAARAANREMPTKVVQRLVDHVGTIRGKKVVVLGLSYRGGVKESAFSGAFSTVQTLRNLGADVSIHDPLYVEDELKSLGFQPWRRGTTADYAIVQTDHDEYANWGVEDMPGVRVVLDGRGILRPHLWADSEVLVIGKGDESPWA